jgi:hypothetical protein
MTRQAEGAGTRAIDIIEKSSIVPDHQGNSVGEGGQAGKGEVKGKGEGESQ